MGKWSLSPTSRSEILEMGEIVSCGRPSASAGGFFLYCPVVFRLVADEFAGLLGEK